MTRARDVANVLSTATELATDTETAAAISSHSSTSDPHTGYVRKATLTAKGDLFYAPAAGQVARLPVGTSGQYLTSDGLTPSWGAVTSLPSQTGNSGKYLTTDGTTASWGAVGLTWTYRYHEPGLNSWNKIEYNGSNLFVAVGNAGKLATSSDGINWTARTSGFGSNAIRSVAFGNGLWVAVGDNGTISTSTDGTTWTTRTANMSTNRIHNVAYANSLWVAVGDGGATTNTGGITYSTDGITWTRKSQSIASIGNGYRCIMWNGTNWIVGAEYGASFNYLYASTPSGTWTAGHTGTGEGIYYLYWDGSKNIEIPQSGGNAYTSTSPTLGSTTQVFGSNFSSSVSFSNYFYNNKIYTVGTYIIETSTTVTNNYFTQIKNLGNALVLNTSTGGIAVRSAGYPMLACSLGYIATDIYGGIFTSF